MRRVGTLTSIYFAASSADAVAVKETLEQIHMEEALTE